MRRCTFLADTCWLAGVLRFSRWPKSEGISSRLAHPEFADPPAVYRPAPFFAWNDLLEESELRWQLQEFKRAGFGGVFDHAPIGLVTPYVSEDWMRSAGTSGNPVTFADLKWIADFPGYA